MSAPNPTLPIIPNLPLGALTSSRGVLNNAWLLYLQQLTQNLQAHLSNEGLRIPSQTSANIIALESNLLPKMIHNSDTDEYFLKINGAFKKIMTEP